MFRFKLMMALFITACPLLIEAREINDQGINWVKGLTWQQVKEKAKKENRYIFIDVYATWCGPCKEMDKRVYVNDSVGNFINDKFISVKVQMDITKNDEPEVQRWYKDAQDINKQYRVLSLPTFIFLAPNGRVAHKAIGYKTVEAFIAEAAIALKPGQVYIDPFEEYDRLEADYHAGKKKYSRMLYMIRSARELGKQSFDSVLTKDYYNYLEQLDRKKIYTKEILEFLAALEMKSEAKLFSLFYPDGRKVDKVMGIDGFSKRIVSLTIYREITSPYLRLKTGATPLGNGPLDTAEANWEGLYHLILKKYSREYAQRGVLNGKLVWYEQRYNFPAFYATYLQKLDRYGFDSISTTSNTAYPNVNFNCWFLFLRISDKVMLQKAAKWMEALVHRFPQDPTYIDTYANLLYKAGEKEKAIVWEEKALKLAIEKKWQRYIENYVGVLAKMKAGKPTW